MAAGPERLAQRGLALGRQQLLLGRPGLLIRDGPGIHRIPGRRRCPHAELIEAEADGWIEKAGIAI